MNVYDLAHCQLIDNNILTYVQIFPLFDRTVLPILPKRMIRHKRSNRSAQTAR